MLVDTRFVRGEAPPTRPGPQTLYRFGGGHSNRHHVLSGFNERNAQQRGEPAARFDLGSRPLLIVGPGLIRFQTKPSEVHLPDDVFFLSPRQIEEKRPIQPFASEELGREFGDIIARQNEKRIRAATVTHPGQQAAEHSGGNSAIVCPGPDSGQGLFDLVDQHDGTAHRVDGGQGPPCVLLGGSHDAAHQAANIQDDRWAIEFVAKCLGQGRFSTTGRREQQDSTGHGFGMPIG